MVESRTVLSVLVLALAYYYYNSSTPVPLESPEIKTLSGSVKGIISKSRDGRDFYEYLGIPYGKSERFEPPQPADKWLGIRDASKYGSICLQTDTKSRKIHGEEDCLFVNVFIPKDMFNKKEKLPVLVWIHGGMFVFGSSDLYRPDYFMDHDIILITLNYRLGSLGFLNTGDGVVRGNNGLRDQNLALRWVQQNIEYFGGDKDRVTIFGESAGGSSVHHQILSPQSKGLYNKAIAQSGTSVGAWGARTNPAKQAKVFSKHFNCPTEDTKAMVKCLKAVDGVKLMEASYADVADDLRDPITVFNPSIEAIKDENAFLTELPADMLRKGNFNKVPWLTGVNSQEGHLISAPIFRDRRYTELVSNFEVNFANLIWLNEKMKPEALAKVKEFYFKNEKMDADDKFQNWTNLLSDNPFAAPAQKAISLQAEHAPVYAYYYSYEGQFSLTDYIFALPGKYHKLIEYTSYFLPRWFKKTVLGIQPIHMGPNHFDECALLFHLKDNHYIKQNDVDYIMSKLMVKAWVQFATDPVDKLPEFNGVKWPFANYKGKGKPLQYMHIDKKSSVIDEPNAERNRFWNTLKV